MDGYENCYDYAVLQKNEFKINIMETLNWVLCVIQLKFTTVPYELAYNTICNLDNTIPKLTCNNYFSKLLKGRGATFSRCGGQFQNHPQYVIFLQDSV